MRTLNKDDILKADDLVTQVVNVKEWGGAVVVRTMTGAERDFFESSLFSDKGADKAANIKNLRARLLSLCLADEEGKRLFTDKECELLGGKSSKVIDRLYTIAARLNAIGAVEEEELTKNSDGEAGGTSTSASPENSA